MVFSCDTQEKQTKLSLVYNHSERNLRQVQETPVRHNIKVEPDIAEAWLDSNMSATVEVPVDTSMHVDYKNYTTNHPDIYYEYGSSNPFYVTHNSPDSIYITIAVSVNSDYPVQETETIDNETTECTENCIVDNSTVDNETITYTDNATWSDNFTQGVTTTQTQKTYWRNFWDNLSVGDNWSYISVGHIDNVTHFCDNSSIVSQIITQIQNDNVTNWNTSCNQMNWITGGCGAGLSIELSVKLTGTGDCACNRVNDNTTTIRPAITNRNWGGVGVSCGALSQSLEVILKK
jgi:hypothetical protein